MSTYNVNNNKTNSIAGDLLESLRNIGDEHGVTPEHTSSIYSVEDISGEQRESLDVARDNMSTRIKSTIATLAEQGYNATTEAIEAATYAGILAADPTESLSRGIPKKISSTNEDVIVMDNTFVGDQGIRPDLESYSPDSNGDAIRYAVTYTLQAMIQGPIGRVCFPAITQNPGSIGFSISTPIISVQNVVTRNLSGNPTKFDKVNILRAYRDPTILKDDATKLIPIVRTGVNDTKFVPTTTIAPTITTVDGVNVSTSFIKTDIKVDLIDLGMTDAMVSAGASNETDSIDPGMTLDSLLLEVGTVGDPLVPATNTINHFIINTVGTQNSTYYPSVQDGTQSITLAYDNVVTLISTTPAVGIINVNSGFNALPTTIVVTVGLSASGFIDTEIGDATTNGHVAHLLSVWDNSTNTELVAGNIIYDALAIDFSTSRVIGWKPLGYYKNTNALKLGQLGVTNDIVQLYNVTPRSPVSVRHPEQKKDYLYQNEVNVLSEITRSRMESDAASTLLQHELLLASYTPSTNPNAEIPKIFGTGRHVIIPTYVPGTLDVGSNVQVTNTSEVRVAIQALIFNNLRELVTVGLVNSEYCSGLEKLGDGIVRKPKFAIVMGKRLASYAQVDGDPRLLGGDVDYEIVVSPDKRFDTKIIMVPIIQSAGGNRPNPLNSGNMLWVSEVPTVHTITRANRTSKERTLTPRYLHVMHCPLLMSLTVTGLENTIKTIPFIVNNTVI